MLEDLHITLQNGEHFFRDSSTQDYLFIIQDKVKAADMPLSATVIRTATFTTSTGDGVVRPMDIIQLTT